MNIKEATELIEKEKKGIAVRHRQTAFRIRRERRGFHRINATHADG